MMTVHPRTTHSLLSFLIKSTAALGIAVAVLVAAGRSPRPADAAYHFMVIDEVMAGVPGDSTVQYVELKMTAPGQIFVAGRQVVVYNAAGAPVGTFTFPGNVANGALLARILIATPSAVAYYGVAADLTMTPVMTSTGMVCWFDPTSILANMDCVPYGNYSQPNINQSSQTKGPATVNPPGNGYASLMRVGTTFKSALDFALLCPTPQNNANVIGAPPLSDPDVDLVNGGGGCTDNCPTIANAGQANNDRNFTDLAPFGKAYNDLTSINADLIGEPCDPDDDNDGLPDTSEMAGPPCASASAATNPMVGDSDGDRVLDGAECALGTDPASAASKPAVAACGPAGDSDGDAVRDQVEFCNYNSNVSNINTDGDFCGDGKEIASINGDSTANSTDLQQVASAFGPSTGLTYILDFDTDKNGTINSTDLQFVAGRFGPCP